MEYKRMICPNCGANIDFKSDQVEVCCEYCGGKYPTGYIPQPNAEQNGYDFEKGRQRAIMEQQPLYYNAPTQQPVKKNNYLWLWILGWTCFFPVPLTVLIWKSQKLDTKWKTILTVALWGFLLIWGKIGGDSSQNNSSNESNISVGINSYDLKDMNYSDAKTKFEVAGFTNIILEEIVTEKNNSVGKVVEVSINGDTSFYRYDKYPSDAKVVIRYYSKDNSSDQSTESSNNSESTDRSITEISSTESTIIGDNLPAKNGYNENSNKTIFGYCYSIPDYFGDFASNSDEDSKNLYAEKNNGKIAMLDIVYEDLDCSIIEFDNNKDTIMNNIVSGLDDFNILDYEEIDIDGCSGRKIYANGSIKNMNVGCVFCFFYDLDGKRLIAINFLQTDNCQYSYFDDIEQVIGSIKKSDLSDTETIEKSNAEVTIETTTEVTTEVTTQAITEVTTETTTEVIKVEESTCHYILNTNTKKFHYDGCASVKKMKDKNKQEIDCTRQHLIDLGYSPCGNCKP